VPTPVPESYVRCEEWRQAHFTEWLPVSRPGKRGGDTSKKLGWVETLPIGEEEVKVAKSEAPEITGAWCKREMLRSR
jgi:hypothetical protein